MGTNRAGSMVLALALGAALGTGCKEEDRTAPPIDGTPNGGLDAGAPQTGGVATGGATGTGAATGPGATSGPTDGPPPADTGLTTGFDTDSDGPPGGPVTGLSAEGGDSEGTLGATSDVPPDE